jgi:hypothetical protein
MLISADRSTPFFLRRFLEAGSGRTGSPETLKTDRVGYPKHKKREIEFMHLKRVALPVLALTLAAAGPRVGRASGAAPIAPGQISIQVQWDAPPQELNEIQRRGFHDGIEGARRDFENHRPPNVENREEYRHPELPPEQREVYRDGFRRGYARAMAHLTGRQWEY